MGVVIFLIGAWLVYHAIKDARQRAWTGPRTPAMRGRASGSSKAVRSPAPGGVRTAGRSAIAAATHPRNSQIRAQAKADANRAWTEVKTADWLEQRRHERANGSTPSPGSNGGGVTTTVRRRLGKLLPFTPGTSDGDSQGGGTTPQWPPTADTDGTRPEPPDDGYHLKKRPPGFWGETGGTRPHPEPSPTASTNGGTTVAGTSTASAQKMIEGINEIQANAAAGGIHAKREALAAIREGAVRFAAMVQMLSRQMSEPGMSYGPEITEPLARAGQHFNAGAMTVGESDAAIETLINMTVGDLAKSPRQAPHHRELSENGAR